MQSSSFSSRTNTHRRRCHIPSFLCPRSRPRPRLALLLRLLRWALWMRMAGRSRRTPPAQHHMQTTSRHHLPCLLLSSQGTAAETTPKRRRKPRPRRTAVQRRTMSQRYGLRTPVQVASPMTPAASIAPARPVKMLTRLTRSWMETPYARWILSRTATAGVRRMFASSLAAALRLACGTATTRKWRAHDRRLGSVALQFTTCFTT